MKKYHLFSAAVLLLVSGSVSAATIEMHYSTANGQKIDYTINGTSRVGWWALQFSPVYLDLDNDSSTWTPDHTTNSYCVDLLQYTNNAQRYEVELQSAVGKGDNYRNAAWLMREYSSTVSTAAEMAGLQVAIWEAVYDHGSLSLDAGNFSVQSNTSGAYSNATTYLAALAGATSFTGLEHYMVAYSKDYQDQLIHTPIPMAVWLFGSGLLGLVSFRRGSGKA